MERLVGVHLYIDIRNFDEVLSEEHDRLGGIAHSVHALDTIFSSIESYGKRTYDDLVVEKITGSRLHLYILGEPQTAYDAVVGTASYANEVLELVNRGIGKYRSLPDLEMRMGAAHGKFHVFEFDYDKDEEYSEVTSIGYVANIAAKVQALARSWEIAITTDLYESIGERDRSGYAFFKSEKLGKYGQEGYYAAPLRKAPQFRNALVGNLDDVSAHANELALREMSFSPVRGTLSFDGLTLTQGRSIEGIPLFADVRGFTAQFDSDDGNLEEMAKITQGVLEIMYDVTSSCGGVHVQFQGDREFSVFHHIPEAKVGDVLKPAQLCYKPAVLAAMRMVDGVKGVRLHIGVGEAYGDMYAVRIGARGEKDRLLLGKVVVAADSMEDEHAREDQIAITTEVYKGLKAQDPQLAGHFRWSGGGYVTTVGYQQFVRDATYARQQASTRDRGYNGAWSPRPRHTEDVPSVGDVLVWRDYLESVRRDFEELKKAYPFAKLHLPMVPASGVASVRVVAVHRDIVEECMGREEDFTGEYSKVLHVEVPLGYKTIGCRVYGGSWIDLAKVDESDRHFLDRERRGEHGYCLCVGVPASFSELDNVMLECVRTAENLLVGYERLMRDESKRLEAITYTHGDKGIREYEHDTRRFRIGERQVSHG